MQPSYQQPELFYWVREEPQSAAELDYLWRYNQHIIPIEVKAGKTGRLKSLQYFIRNKRWNFAVRFNSDLPSLLHETAVLPKHAPIAYRLLSLPFYLAPQLPRLIEASIKHN